MRRHRIARAAFLCAAAALAASCAGVRYRYGSDGEIAGLLAKPAAEYPAARFAVFSDPHLYDTALGTEGKAFKDYMDNDRKLLPESGALLDAAIAEVEGLGAGFLLIPGDLTKDGERQNHLLMAQRLAELARKGIRTFVVPGNHDINNPKAMSYGIEGAARVPNVTPEEFAEIYGDCGYREALFRDPGSLSYVAEPVPGLWLLAVDSANYAENAGKASPVTGSGLTQARLDWIESMLAEAVRQGKAVLAMMHHGVVEHYKGQEKYFKEYLVTGWQQFSDMLAAYNVRVAFTGHNHAQDITRKTAAGGKFIYDVETGSLVSHPDPVRGVEILPSQQMTIDSSFVAALPAQGGDFPAYSRSFFHEKVVLVAIKTMNGLGVPNAESETLAPQIGDAFTAHAAGDERFTGTEMLKLSGLSLMGSVIVGDRKDLVTGLWNDLPPVDNALAIDLGTGAWTPR